MKKSILLISLLIFYHSSVFALNLSRVKTWSASEVLTAADLNAEYDNILNHAIANADIASGAAIVASKLDLTSPGAIGSTAANTGAFTTLSSTSDVTFDTRTFKLNATTDKVGIGTTSPGSVLSVRGSVGIGTTSTTSLFHLTAEAPDGGLLVEGRIGIGTTNPLALLQAGTSPNPGLLVTAGGNVGIGSTNPTTLLRIGKTGTWTFDGSQTVSGTWADLGIVTTVDLNGGTIDGVTIGASSAPTVTNLGSVTTCDINGGTVDGVTIGGASAGAITGTTITANTGVTTAGLTATADLDISSYELRAQTFESDVTTGTAPMTIASTTKVTNLNSDLLDGANTATTATGSAIYIAGADTYLPDATVDTTALKTTSGEVSRACTGTNNAYFHTLPGGAYGFYPRTKTSDAAAHENQISIWGDHGTTMTGSATYAAYCTIRDGGGGETLYAEQTYVTASGQDYWLFLLVEKATGDIVSIYAAQDHPSYGAGGDYEKIAQPFGNYDLNAYEVILVDNDTIAELKTQEIGDKKIADIVNENYKVNFDKEETYKPLHSGKWLIQKDTGEILKTVPLGEDMNKFKQVKQLVEKIPDYIKVRKLVKLSEEEKENKRQRNEDKTKQNRLKKQSQENKIKDKLNLNDNDFEELKAILR